ncbi:hypothetical protein PP175_05790 [Aneurinibacillus sp. Ricciae_BoGa-3]|uniref:hypothetical protein n=1 Tax=Aneurinibacillus sp. Ricciae_BoGa-3 TaxID=3022697 RepID=UPI0023409EAE|nr:hypothetical protein [Aneurinibacillus sp. Ricciae_BoGa-3]WCK55460.1 hypothetical protein PP175_05790 [Aneurinibacillus sp. Ricciae_BoGa-3]
MKGFKKVFAILITAAVLTGLCSPAFADVYVHGYYKKNGTYVKPHWRSNPDHTVANNWSTKGNVNPHTGKKGTRTYGGMYGGKSVSKKHYKRHKKAA